MPIYKITDSETNQTLRIEGDAPPTEADIENIFANYKAPVKESSVELEEQPSEPVEEKPDPVIANRSPGHTSPLSAHLCGRYSYSRGNS